MGLDELQPGNTLRAKATALSAFKKFLKAEGVAEEYVRKCIERDISGRCFVSVMDKFGMHLAFSKGKKGKPLARNTAMQYYRQAKLWLLDQFPQHRASLETRLLKMGKTLDSFCLKREGGGFVNKAPPCTKSDLKQMLVYLYTNASCDTDYQDAALLCLLWYLFGRASDLSMLRKRNVSVDAGGVLFLRLIRVKTSEEQGLSLFPDEEFLTCPLLALALALIVQRAPSDDLVGNLPRQETLTTATISDDVSLVELLNAPAAPSTLSVPATKGTPSTPTVYSHVNRVLERIAPAAGVTKALSLHSFRRGGAQHANGSEGLTDRWIFDRGSWNMSTTNKGFNYIFNTSKEDHKVAKVLAGYEPKTKVKLQDLSSFDSQTLEQIKRVQDVMFMSCSNLATSSFNVNKQVVDILTAAVFRYFPLLKELSHSSPVVTRVEGAVRSGGSTLADLLAWSAHLSLAAEPCNNKQTPENDTTHQAQQTKEQKIIDHQASVIKHLIDMSKRQDERMDALEAKLNNVPVLTIKRNKPSEKEGEQEVSTPKKKQRRSGTTHLHATWFAWYAHEPRWHASEPKRQRSNAKLLAAYMKLFLADGFGLDPSAVSYRDDVLALGLRAEKEALSFLAQHKIASRGSSSVLKHLQALHKAGALNRQIERHQRLLQSAAIQDPAPGYTQDVVELVG